jgi:Tol biopolymer transport system component
MKRLFGISLLVMLVLSACAPAVATQQPTIPPVVDEALVPTATEAVPTVPEPSATTVGPKDIQETNTPKPMLPSWLAFVGLDGNINLLDTTSGEQIAVTTDGSSMMDFPQPDQANQYSDPAWSSDGLYLAFKKTINTKLSDRMDSQYSLMVYEASSGETLEVLSDPDLSSFAWKPITHLIAYALRTDPSYFTARGEVDAALARGILAVNIDTMETSELVKPQGYSLILPQWSPDGQFVSFNEIIYMEGRGNFAYYDLEAQQYFSWERPIGNYDWSNDSEMIVYDDLTYISSGEERIYLNDRYDQDEVQFNETDSDYYASNPLFSPDGETVLFKETEIYTDNNVANLWVKTLDGSEHESILEDAEIYDILWSPDGAYALVVLGPYDNPTLLEVNVYDYSTRVLGNGWTPAWQPLQN